MRAARFFVAALAMASCAPDPSTNWPSTGGPGSAPPAQGTPPPAAPSAGGGGPSAKELFLTGAEPLLRPTCNGCHATGAGNAPIFLGATPEDSYTTVTSGKVPGLLAAPGNSELLNHGKHTGPALVQTQIDAVTKWLEAEAKERGLDAKPLYTEKDALKELAACMRYEDFASSSPDPTGGKGGLPGLPGLGGPTAFADIADVESDQGACKSCHNTGDGGFWASSGLVGGTDLTRVMFDKTKETPYVLKLVKGTTDAAGKFVDLVPSDTIATQQTTAAACVGAGCHPKFTLSADQAQAIKDFVDTTLQRWRSKQCATASDAGTD